LHGYGYDARVVVGTVTVDNQTYGHAWVEVQVSGQWGLLESTRGTALDTMKPCPSFYKAAYSFNESNVRFFMVLDEELRAPPSRPQLLNGCTYYLEIFEVSFPCKCRKPLSYKRGFLVLKEVILVTLL